MQFIVCLLSATLGLALASSEIVDAATSQFTSQRLTLGEMPTHSFGTQVDTEYDEDLKPETRMVSEADSDGLTLGITIGTQPLTLRRFGTQKIAMTEIPLKRFGAQVNVPSEVKPEEPLADGLQRWGSQVSSDLSHIAVEPAFDDKIQHFGSQGSEASEIPVEPRAPLLMADAMTPGLDWKPQKPQEAELPSIVVSEAPLRHSWNDSIVVSEVPLSHFGKGAAVKDLDLSWHLAWQPDSPAESTGALRATTGARAGRSKSHGAQEQLKAAEPDSETEILPSFEPVVEVWRYCALIMCLACLAMHMCRSQQIEAKPLLAA